VSHSAGWITVISTLNENLVDVNYIVTVKDRKPNKVEKIKGIRRMRYWFISEIEFILQGAGFHLIEAGKWMIGKTPGFRSCDVYFVWQ